MADPINGNEVEEELVDYEEEEAPEPDQAAKGEDGVKRCYVGLHTAGFKEFLLKPEILRAITKNAFEHPSEGALSDLGSPLLLSIYLAFASSAGMNAWCKLQYNTSAFPVPLWARTFFARPSQEWERQLSLCCQFFSRSKLSLMRRQR